MFGFILLSWLPWQLKAESEPAAAPVVEVTPDAPITDAALDSE